MSEISSDSVYAVHAWKRSKRSMAVPTIARCIRSSNGRLNPRVYVRKQWPSSRMTTGFETSTCAPTSASYCFISSPSSTPGSLARLITRTVLSIVPAAAATGLRLGKAESFMVMMVAIK